MKKKMADQEKRMICREIIITTTYICFICNESRVLECWIKDKSYWNGSMFYLVRQKDIEAIERLIIPNLEEYWAISKKTDDHVGDKNVERRCVTVFNPSWRKQVAKNVSS